MKAKVDTIFCHESVSSGLGQWPGRVVCIVAGETAYESKAVDVPLVFQSAVGDDVMVLGSKAVFGEDNFFPLHVGYLLAAMGAVQPLCLTGAVHYSGFPPTADNYKQLCFKMTSKYPKPLKSSCKRLLSFLDSPILEMRDIFPEQTSQATVNKGLETGYFDMGDLTRMKLWWDRPHVSYEKKVRSPADPEGKCKISDLEQELDKAIPMGVCLSIESQWEMLSFMQETPS
ncbi:hypothetical protein llap_7529 [Limosa lapponica baueri]|uniref:Uncharacterized protein n=1 Tax=Limosa lapponica baueri TaxID=1758121 RepID=A0A2I0U7X4_LIMLA|nr:hypothetical protein llap_7529 [Limosa lapponica baueri]